MDVEETIAKQGMPFHRQANIANTTLLA